MTPVDAALDDLHGTLTRFVELLEDEKRALEHIHADTLSAVVEDKKQCSEAANAAWHRLVAAAGVDLGRGERLETALASQPALQSRWQAVRDLAARAEQINQSNSILIDAQMKRTRQALDILQNASDRSSLYGADGLMEGSLTRRHTLDKV